MIKYNNNNINNNCRYNNGATAVDATAVDATAAIVVIFPLVVAVLRAFTCSTTGTQTNQNYPSDHENRRILVSFQSFHSKIGP